MVNRLRPVLQEVISPNQSAFIPGRLITDNALIAFECVHAIQKGQSERTNFCAYKLDMSKAYDRADWNFMEGIMARLGFHEQWIRWVMVCATSVRYAVKFNGNMLRSFTPSRGLRQGDPLSPYLFILCAEGLSAMLQKAEAEEKIKGFCICRGAPRVNHLFFVDDSLILMQSRYNDAFELRRILSIYERVSGQVINKDKSSILFSPNSGTQVKG